MSPAEVFSAFRSAMGYSPGMECASTIQTPQRQGVGQWADASDSSTGDESFDFCRKARRLRATAGRQRRVLHEQLSRLKVDRSSPVCRSTSATSMVVEPLNTNLTNLQGDDTLTWASAHSSLSSSSSMTEGLLSVELPSRSGSFAQYVAGELAGPVLHYEQRVALLREAHHRGISRFEANLVIAAVQHQAIHPPRKATPQINRWALRTLLVVTAVQSLIVLGLYRILHG